MKNPLALGTSSPTHPDPRPTTGDSGEGLSDRWLRLWVALFFLQSMVVFAWASSAHAVDDYKSSYPPSQLDDPATSSSADQLPVSKSGRSAAEMEEEGTAGRIERSFPEVRPAETGAELKPSVGVLAGYNNLNGDVNGNFAGGVDIGFQPVIPFTVALQIAYAPSDVETGPLSEDFDTTNVFMKFAYNFGGDIPVVRNTYFGFKTGLAFYDFRDNSETKFGLGPVVGMDFPIDPKKKLTIGPEASYVGFLGDDSPDQMAILGAVKYWF